MHDQLMLAHARQREDQRHAEQYRLARALLAHRRVRRQERRARHAMAQGGRVARLVAA